MILLDANVLLFAFRRDAPRHEEYRKWLIDRAMSLEPFGISEIVLSSLVRIATHPQVFRTPSSLADTMAFVQAVRERSNCVLIAPGPRHWDVFSHICRASDARGNHAGDAYLAALAIESGSEWITTDRDYSRFQGLRWRHPLA